VDVESARDLEALGSHPRRWGTWPGIQPGIPTISVVAKSNTGKTTLLEQLLPILRAHGLRVGVLKHHSHLSSFDVPGKDTYRLAEAGADVVVGASPLQVAVFRRENGSADLDSVLATHFAGMDLVLTEGYKRGPYPKIEVHRSARSNQLICRFDELLALVSDRNWKLPLGIPLFPLNDPTSLAELLVARLSARTVASRGASSV
jgi:molybdopterin-guanine dinucleotide biosynthesis protein MobB